MLKWKVLASLPGKVLIVLPLLLTVALVSAKLFPRFTYRMLTAMKLVDATSQHYQLVERSIENGNSLSITDGHKAIGIQLCGIKAPELDQPFGHDSRTHLRELASQGSGRVIVVFAGPDEQGQTLAEVFVPIGDSEELHLNTQMLVEGMASLSPQNLSSCPNGDRFSVAKDIAKQKMLGIWSKPLAKEP